MLIATRSAGIRRRSGLVAAGVLALLGSIATDGRAQEIAPFRLTGVEGYASARFLRDEITTQQSGARSRQELSDMREEVFVMTHSYVYHPSFLTLDLGAGPIFQRGRFSTDSGDTSSSSTLYNLSARASFLREKPYRGSLFYEHLNPTLSVSPDLVMTQENTRYGFDASTLVPMPVNVDASRFRTQGRSAERIADEQIDQFNLRASQAIGRLGSTQLRYQSTQQDSLSGSPNLPVQRTNSDRQNYQLETRLRFGAREQFDLFNLVMYDTQAYGLSQSALPERNDHRFLLDLRGRHSERVNSFGTYNYSSTEQGVLFTTLNAGSAGVSYAPTMDLSWLLSARAEDIRATQLVARSQGADGSVQYRHPLGRGVLSTGYGLRYDQRRQEATAPQASVIGESVTLTGTTPVPLSQGRVVAGGVVVSNATRTQTFTEGIDYVLSVLGLQTRLQRLVAGSILDGETVLADYAYDVGGTFALNQTDQTLNVNWGLANYLNVYFRYFDSAPRLTSGTLTSPLNPAESTIYGARADVPLNRADEWVLGGSYEQEDRREVIAPYTRQQYDVYAQTEVSSFGPGNIRVSRRRVNQDFENTSEDVRLTGYDVSLWTRHPLGVDLSARASYERDTGGQVPRTRQLATAKAQWRYRRASLTMDITRTRETQGAFERNRTLAQILLRRDF